MKKYVAPVSAMQTNLTMNTRVLAAAILLAPVLPGLLTRAESNASPVLGSGPILIGLRTQRTGEGR